MAIECKVDGTTPEVVRQLVRYARHPEIRAIVLVTTQARHAAQVPAEIEGRPVCVVLKRHLP